MNGIEKSKPIYIKSPTFHFVFKVSIIIADLSNIRDKLANKYIIRLNEVEITNFTSIQTVFYAILDEIASELYDLLFIFPSSNS